MQENYERKLNQAKVRVLFFMLENDTRNLNNEEFIVKFRKFTQNIEIPSETITRSRRYRKSKRILLDRVSSTEEIEESYKNNFSKNYGLDYKEN